MSSLRKNKHGFGAVGFLAIIFIIGIIGAAYWRVHQSHTENSSKAIVNKQATTRQTGTLRAGKLSIDKSKLPSGWEAEAKTYSKDGADYQTLSFRYAINLTNGASLGNYDRNNPDMCYISAYQIQNNPGDTAEDYIKNDIDRVRGTATATNGLEINFEPASTINLNTAEGQKAALTNTYTVKYQDQGLQTRYNMAAFYASGAYIGQASYTCNSPDAANTAAEIISQALYFN